METNKIYQGDCLELMKRINNNSIDLVITSPPYDNLRNYNGYVFDFENIARELFRIINKGGVLVWVVGDSVVKGSETGSSFKQALFFKFIGFHLHDTMIYKKNQFIPLTHNRYEQEFEFMFIFSKGKPKTFNPIMINCLSVGSKKYRGRAKDYEDSYAERRREETTITRDKKITGNIWGFNVGNASGDDKTIHNAPFPEKLAESHILSWSNEEDIVLDPMCGSGTTCKMALKNNRRFIGMDISEEYCKISNDRLIKLIC